jgi:hypothetical protein
MAARLNVTVDDGVSELLIELAGGERKLGAYISKLVRSVAAGEQEMQPGGDLETLRLAFAGLAGKHKELEGRVLMLERKAATPKPEGR